MKLGVHLSTSPTPPESLPGSAGLPEPHTNMRSTRSLGSTTGFAGFDWGVPSRARNPKVLGGCK